MTDKKTRWSTDGQIRIVLQTFNPEISVAELCRQYNLMPRTVCLWKERFLAGGRSSLDGSDAARQAKRHKREVESLKRIIGEYAVANEALKKRWRGDRMNAVRMMRDVVGLNRSLRMCGVSKKSWYHVPKPRNVPPDPEVRDAILRIAPQRPTYGTRRMAA